MAKPQAEFSEGHKSVTTLKDQHVSSGKKQGVQWDSIPDHVRFKKLFPKHASSQGLFRWWLSFNHPIEADKLLKMGLFSLVEKTSFFKKCNHHLAFCTHPYITNQELLLIQSWTYLPQQVPHQKKMGSAHQPGKKSSGWTRQKRINSFFNPGYFCFIWLKKTLPGEKGDGSDHVEGGNVHHTTFPIVSTGCVVWQLQFVVLSLLETCRSCRSLMFSPLVRYII